jgi:hypothetical protein
MIRTKTLSLPLVSALLASATLPAVADVALTLSSQKSYRQNKKGESVFRGGRFDITLRDGNGIYVAGCVREAYWPPNVPLDPCPGGSTAFILFGDVDPEVPNGFPYYWMTDVIPALIIEPRRPDLCKLRAAPASDLPRPSTDFKDASYGLYYNLHEADVRESVITRYDSARTYGPDQRGKFEDEIVTGVYHYLFPRLGQSNLRVPISPVIYPMPEGYAKINNQKTGVQFIDNGNWSGGFMELSYIKPNVIQWKGFSPAVTYPAVDNLYFSMRFLANPRNPRSEITIVNPVTSEAPASFFPGYVNGGDPRILLANPFVESFTLPPVFPGGSTAVIELELDRAFQTGGVTYDFSTRKFQIPVKIVNRYSEYAELRFGNKDGQKGTDLKEDFDKDGFNNITEWILDSRADDSTSVPRPILALPRNVGNLVDPQPYFGFTFTKKRGTVPRVVQTLQRSTNNGRTWRKFVSDANWTVTETAEEFIVQSNFDNLLAIPVEPVQPPGTAGDLYRIKVTPAN